MPDQTYNPWTIVNLVFAHLAEQGLQPVLGGPHNPGEPAADLLRALGIVPALEGDNRVREGIGDELAALRARMLGDPGGPVSH